MQTSTCGIAGKGRAGDYFSDTKIMLSKSHARRIALNNWIGMEFMNYWKGGWQREGTIRPEFTQLAEQNKPLIQVFLP